MNKEDKEFLGLCGDMVFWFDNVVGNDELMQRYYNLTQEREEEHKNLESDHNILIDEMYRVQKDMSKLIKKESNARKRFADAIKKIREAVEHYKEQKNIMTGDYFITSIRDDYTSLSDLKYFFYVLYEDMEISDYSFDKTMKTIKNVLGDLQLLVEILKIINKGE